jgi:DNA-binding transcriptional LysR family regulator
MFVAGETEYNARGIDKSFLGEKARRAVVVIARALARVRLIHRILGLGMTVDYTARVDTLAGIRVFRQVVESGSFVAAAERLEMSTAMVSKHVMHIEKRLGVRLLNRNNRTLSLTEPGRVYFERCKTILDDLEQTELELGSLNSAPRGTLRITAPSWFAAHTLGEFLADYRRQYPDIVLDLSFEDRITDIVAEGYDLALRVTRESLPAGLIARRVGSVSFVIAGSRTYLKQRGTPRSPEELAGHDGVLVGDYDTWPLIGASGTIEVPVRAVLRLRSLAGVANAVAAGVGLAPLPDFCFTDPAYRQVLTPVLKDYPVLKSTLYAVYVSRKYIPLKIRSFIDLFVEYNAKIVSQLGAD